jgi:hypothetical protein
MQRIPRSVPDISFCLLKRIKNQKEITLNPYTIPAAGQKLTRINRFEGKIMKKLGRLLTGRFPNQFIGCGKKFTQKWFFGLKNDWNAFCTVTIG